MGKFIFFSIVALNLLLMGCQRADPNAYTRDPVLGDYQSQLQTTQSQLDEMKKKLEETEKELKTSQPQKGQTAIHRKRREEQLERITKLNQQITYWQVRIESRAKEAQLEYLESFKKGKEWPDQAAVDSYHAQKRLRLNRLQWNQKERIKEMQDKEAAKPADSH
jgi:hypothetical protein